MKIFPNITVKKLSCIACLAPMELSNIYYTHSFVNDFKGGFVRCKKCGSEVVLPPVDTELLYVSRVTSSNYPQSHGLLVAIKMILLSYFAKSLLKGRNSSSYVLDYGCGGGELANAVSLIGFKHAWASDVQVTRPLTLSSAVGYIQVAELNLKIKFEVIIMRHVLEHLSDPIVVLKKLKEILNPSGQLIVEVPSTCSIWKRFMGRLWPGYFYPYHVSVLSEAGAKHIFSRAGLHVVSVRPVEPPIFGVFLIALGVPRGAARILSALLYPLQWTISKLTRSSEALLFVVSA